MGKIKRQRRKLHPPAAKPKVNDESDQMDEDGLQPSTVFPTQGLFAGSVGGHSLPDHSQGKSWGEEEEDEEDDRRSFISKKSVKGDKQLSKVEKRKLRHERWLEKIDTINTAKRKASDAKKRADVPVVGDMHPLHDALPELSEILRIGQQHGQTKSKNNQPDKKPRATPKMKDRQKLMLEETARFHEVLKHSAFKKSPFATINLHLKNKLAQEQGEEQT